VAARVSRRRGGDGVDNGEPEIVWLLMEWERGESAPTKHHVIWFPEQSGHRLTRKQAVRVVKQRWRTERVYEDRKGELGLDHFEGRRFRGWHHHVSVALACFAFVVAERARAFPPSGGSTRPAGPKPSTAGTALPGFLHHRASRLASSCPRWQQGWPQAFYRHGPAQ
jgi:hypothetical protein